MALRTIRVHFPDKTIKSVKLPRVRRLRIGAKYSHLVAFKQKLFVVWFTRVKHGWEVMNEGPRTGRQS
jgi:hypothetical protein